MARWLSATVGLLALVGGAPVASAAPAVDRACGPVPDAAGLTEVFDHGFDGLVGADYQRAAALPDGRTLWFFQDAYVAAPAAAKPVLLHNVGAIQDGGCFRLLTAGGTADPVEWIGSERTTARRHWFWPLGGVMTGAATYTVFVAEMMEHGPHYLSQTTPVATWVADIDLDSLTVAALRPAPDPGDGLFGWAVAADSEHTYLYANCYRQFGFGPMGHAPCAGVVHVARLPAGAVDGTIEYWDGLGWSTDASAAVDIAPRRAPDGSPRDVNPMQIHHRDGRWLAITKGGDWWGEYVYFDVAASPTGPWTTTAVVHAPQLSPTDETNTYFASFVPSQSSDSEVVSLSNNRWDGELSDVYRPTFFTVPLKAWRAEHVAR